MKYTFIAEQRARYPVARLCRALDVSPSGYYSWQRRPLSRRALANQALLVQIRASHAQSQRTYGSPRIHADLVAQGQRCSRKRVARLMRQARLQARSRRRFRTQTTQADQRLPVAPNRLQRPFRANAPNQVWLSDVTYVPTAEGWLRRRRGCRAGLALAARGGLGNGQAAGYSAGVECPAPGPGTAAATGEPAASL